MSGPISDANGRRRFVIVESLAFALASTACAVAPNIGALLVSRVAEGLAGGTVVATGRAMVTDRYDDAEAAKRFATMFVFLVIGPIIAPVIGSVLLVAGDWRTTFGFLAVLGLASRRRSGVDRNRHLSRRRRDGTDPWLVRSPGRPQYGGGHGRALAESMGSPRSAVTAEVTVQQPSAAGNS